MQGIEKCKKEVFFSYTLLKKSTGYLFAPYFLISIFLALIPLVQLKFLNTLLDLLINGEGRDEKWMYLSLYLLTLLIVPFLSNINSIIYRDIWAKENHEFDRMVENKLVKLPMAYLDSVQGRDRIDAMLNAKYYICRFGFTLVYIVSSLITCAIAAYHIGCYKVWGLLLFFVLSIIGAIFVNYSDTLIYAWNVKSAPDVRKFSYYRWMLTDFWPAKDVRMYNLLEPIKKRYDEEKRCYLKKKNILTKKGLRLGAVSIIFSYLGLAIFLWMLLVDAVNYRITVGELGYFVGAAVIVIDLFGGIVSSLINSVSVANKRFEDCWFFFEECDEDEEVKSDGSISGNSFKIIEFKNVSFRYPFMDEYVLRGVNFSIKAGEKLSIVGINGCGKTTIIKLLMGLYQPTAGEIFLNGRSYSSYSMREIRGLFSAIFQDFVTYPITIQDNVGLSDLEGRNEYERVQNALQKSGLLKKVESMANREKTWITRQFSDEGEELSGGERQKLALARTYFKEAPIIVFDEPSAALDAEAEEKVIEDYQALSSDKAAILISHRMSGVKIADKILVLDRGRIVEEGTHEELLKSSGMYCQLYMVQKEKFLKG